MNGINGLLITINGKEYILQQAAIVWLVIGFLMCLFFIFCHFKIKNADPTKAPKGLILILLEIYNFVMFTIQGNLDRKTNKYLPMFGSLILMMAVSNLVGLLGFQPPTSNIGINATLAVIFWLFIQGRAIKDRGFIGRMKELADPNWLLFPLNLIGELVIPLSLSMRLFGNILSGTIIVTLFYGMFEFLNSILSMLGVSLFLFAPFLHMYFDIFSGLIQTYVFFTIASFFLGQAGNNE